MAENINIPSRSNQARVASALEAIANDKGILFDAIEVGEQSRSNNETSRIANENTRISNEATRTTTFNAWTDIETGLEAKAIATSIELENTHKKDEQSVTWANIAQDAREQIIGTTPPAVVGVNSVGTDNLIPNSVTADKIKDVDYTIVSANLFNKATRRLGGYYNITNGVWSADVGYDTSDFIPVKPDTGYTKHESAPYAIWDINKNFIEGGNWVGEFTTPSNAYYATVAFPVSIVETANFTETSRWTVTYVPYSEVYVMGDKWRIPDIDGDSLYDVIVTSQTDNLFNKDSRKSGGYYEITDNGVWKNDSGYDSSDFTLVKPNYIYKKSSAESYCEWDKDKNFIRGGVAQDFITTKNTAYVTFAVAKSEVDTYKIMPITKWVDTYVSFVPKYVLGSSWDTENRQYLEDRIKSTAQNTYLRVPTPYNDLSNDPWVTNQTTHPSVVQFAEPWNGWKYWMAHTPYPHGADQKENPCIAVSNNGIKWEEPTGIVNPVVPPLVGWYEYNSDTSLLYNDATQKLELWYREVTDATIGQIEKIKRITSSDGVTWSVQELMITGVDGDVLTLISPSVIYSDNQYKMWVMRGGNPGYIVYMTSADGISWSEPIEVLANGQRIWSWHPSVQLRNGVYHMLNNVGRNTINYCTATVGNETAFSAETTIMERTGNEWDLDGYGLYRASAIWTGFDSVIVIYGTMSHQNDWLLGASSGIDFYHLKPITQRALDFYGIE